MNLARYASATVMLWVNILGVAGIDLGRRPGGVDASPSQSRPDSMTVSRHQSRRSFARPRFRTPGLMCSRRSTKFARGHGRESAGGESQPLGRSQLYKLLETCAYALAQEPDPALDRKAGPGDRRSSRPAAARRLFARLEPSTASSRLGKTSTRGTRASSAAISMKPRWPTSRPRGRGTSWTSPAARPTRPGNISWPSGIRASAAMPEWSWDWSSCIASRGTSVRRVARGIRRTPRSAPERTA